LDFRWKYKIAVDVEATRQKALTMGYVANEMEGQSTKGTEYSLGIIEISGGQLTNLKVKVQIGAEKTQVYSPNHEIIIKVEGLLNELTVRLDDEKRLFSKEIRVEVQTLDYLKYRSELISTILRLQDESQKEYKRKIAYAELTFKGEELISRLDEIQQTEMETQRSKLQTLTDLGITGAKDKLDKFNKYMEIIKRWDTEYLSALPSDRESIDSRHREELNRLIVEGFL